MELCLSVEERDEMAIPSYTHPNPAMRWMAWRRVEMIAQHLQAACVSNGISTPRCIMDYGCGAGVLLETASQFAERVYGVDTVLSAAELLVEEWELSKVRLLKPTAAEREIPGSSLDFILAGEVLEHIDPLCKTLDMFQNLLKPEGKLLVSLPTEGLLYRIGRHLAGFSDHYHKSNAAEIHKEILRAGFEIQRVQKIPAPGPLSIYWVLDYALPPSLSNSRQAPSGGPTAE
jgi:SAM-dependent methyltransferase